MSQARREITTLLKHWSDGDDHALEELMPLVFDDLRRMASRSLSKEAKGHILQSTALVNEVLIRLLKVESVRWENRKQFFKFAGEQMRNTLIDHARKAKRAKRGGGAHHSSLEEAISVADCWDLDLVALGAALSDLAQLDPVAEQVVELKFFVGLTLNEIAEVMDVSLMTVRRRWKKAKIWLYCELSRAGKAPEPRSDAAGEGRRSALEQNVRKASSDQPSNHGLPEDGSGPQGRVDGPWRFLQARFPGKIVLGAPVVLRARIVLGNRERPGAAKPATLELTLDLHSPSFEQENGNTRRLLVSAGKATEWVGFTLKALEQGVHTLRFIVYCNDTSLSTLTMDTRVVLSASTVSDDEYFEQIVFPQA